MNKPTTAEIIEHLREAEHAFPTITVHPAQLYKNAADRLGKAEHECKSKQHVINALNTNLKALDGHYQVKHLALHKAEQTIRDIGALPDKWIQDCCVSLAPVKFAIELKANELQSLLDKHNG